jgi:diguanylate cyclase (GGDEF)-like protein
MAPVLDLFEWQLNGSTIGVVWRDDVGLHHVCTADVPAALVGGDREPGEPWRRAQDTGAGVHDHEQALLDDHRRALARTHRLGPLWVEPVVTTEGSVVALITVWSRPAGRGPEGHAYGMTLAKSHVELIVRWGQQLRRLEHSAHHDTLTGLANRKAFFDALGAGGSEVGALLYCDLDRFKPVNDELGHAAGDHLLRQVGARLRASVRDGDLVARIGGDEFCVLCQGASAAEAAEVAARITRAFDPPFEVAGRPVVIGISIGIAHARDGLGDHTLEEADRALYATQQARRAP